MEDSLEVATSADSIIGIGTSHEPPASCPVVSRPCAIRVTTARARSSYRFIAHGISSGARVSAAPYYGLLSGSKPHIHDPGTGHEREANLRYHLPSSPSPSLPPPLFSVASWPVSYFEKGRKERKKEPSFRIDFLPSGWRDGLDRFHERNKIFRLSTGLLPGPLS